MRMLRAFFLRVGGLFDKERRERELADEIESHLSLHIEDNLRAGMNPQDARREALLRLGGVEPAKEAYRDRRSLPWLETLLQDLRYATRIFRKNPGFSSIAVATLGLGIGANTAMFSVAQAVLWRPLPYTQPGRLIEISEINPLKRWTHAPASPANFADWRKRNTVFTDIAAYDGTDAKGASQYDLFLTGEGEPQQLKGLESTGNLFEVLGVKPLLGRTFTEEETYDGKDRVVILTYGLWQRIFGGDPNVIGRKISLTGKNYDVIGVMPREFFFPSHDVQIFLSEGFKPNDFIQVRRPHWLKVIARLRPGVSIGQAREQMTAIARTLEEMYPDTNTQMGVRLDEFHAVLTQETRPALRMLLGAVGVLFLIVCSNVANLQLGRAAARGREIGIRQALGAGRARLVRQLLTESLVLSLLGGVLGFTLAAGARATLARFAPDAIPLFADVRLDWWVFVFNIAITICAPLLFGIVPAIASSRTETLRVHGETGGRTGRSVRDVLVASEVALSVILVIGAGLLIRSLIRLQNVEPGFDPERVLAFNVLFPQIRYPKDADKLRAVQEIERRLRSQARVQAVGAAMVLVLRGHAWTGDATVEGRAAGDYERELRHNGTSPDYFLAIGARLLRGRLLTDFDRPPNPPVTLVNETLAKIYFRGEDPIGKRLKFGRPQDKGEWVTVVGVVGDTKQDGMASRVEPEVYVPMTQQLSGRLTFVIRAEGNPRLLAGMARAQVRAVDKDLALTDITTLRDLLHDSVDAQRFRTSLLAGFAGMALFLAAIGVYGVLAFSVAQRAREIGIRMALGAPPARLFRMVVGEGLGPVVVGSVIGLCGAFAATGVIRTLLFGVTPIDVPTYLFTIAILAVVALCASAVPAWKAIRVDPLRTLREQ